MAGSNQAASVDIENPYISLAASMRLELDSLSPLSSSFCIYKVPERLRCVNEKAYTPQVVSIGPLHHGEIALEAMEEHKKRYLQDFLFRTDVNLEEYIKIIRDKEARLRSCYAEPIKFSSVQFVRIILVDAAFIIELFLRSCGPRVQENKCDRIFNKPRMLRDLLPDIYLLENQLPFFILKDILDLAKITDLSITDLSLIFSRPSIGLLTGADETERISSPSYEPEHFLDIIRLLCQPRMTSEVVGSGPLNAFIIPSITELHRAGVKFDKGSTENGFDIRFHDGILEIPKIVICDETEIWFRNLLAFEQCHFVHSSCYITDYINVMDCLVNTTRDVDLLIKYGIVENGLGDSSKVSTLFNKLGIGIELSGDFTFAVLAENLNTYCNSWWHTMMAILRQNYFNTPWATLSVIAAVVLLILTLIQTVCSILSAASAEYSATTSLSSTGYPYPFSHCHLRYMFRRRNHCP